jgi:hypothetical protein
MNNELYVQSGFERWERVRISTIQGMYEDVLYTMDLFGILELHNILLSHRMTFFNNMKYKDTKDRIISVFDKYDKLYNVGFSLNKGISSRFELESAIDVLLIVIGVYYRNLLEQDGNQRSKNQAMKYRMYRNYLKLLGVLDKFLPNWRLLKKQFQRVFELMCVLLLLSFGVFLGCLLIVSILEQLDNLIDIIKGLYL